jgi:hypothetical protein
MSFQQMDREKEEVQVSNHRSKTNGCLLLIEFGFIIAISVIITTTDEDCDRPIRLWLTMLLFVYAIHSFILLLTECIFSRCANVCIKIINNIYVAGNCIMGPFMFVWFILGNIWLYEADNCYSDWDAGYIMTLVVLIFHYTLFGIVFCIGMILCILICVGNGISARANYKTI